MNSNFAILASTLLLFGVPQQSAMSSTLYGSTVTSAWYCCVSPTEPYRQTEFASRVVGDGLEFSETAYYWFGEGYVSWGGTIDVKQTTIELRSTEDGDGGPPELFGGFTLVFTGAPKIVNVTFDPSSNLLPIGLSFTENSIILNASGAARTKESFAILNIQLAPVPEPSSALLLLGGLTALLAFRRKAGKYDA